MVDRNTTEHLVKFRSEFDQSRQTSITDKLLDVMRGFEVLNLPKSQFVETS